MPRQKLGEPDVIIASAALPERQGSGFVASAAPLRVASMNEAQALAMTRRQWQRRAWDYYDSVGELRYAAQWIGRSVGRLKLVAAELDQDGKPVATDNLTVQRAIKRLKSPRGGQSQFLLNIATNLFMVGEVYMLASENSEQEESWEALSVDELRPNGLGAKDLMRQYSAHASQVKVRTKNNKQPLIIRVWNSHPRFSLDPDCSVRTVLDHCEKLLLLNKADKAVARSRIAGNGILFIPQELIPPSASAARSDLEEDANPFLTNLAQGMLDPIKDENHPSSVVPAIIVGPAEYGDKIRYISFDRPINVRAAALRDETIHRIAAAVDLPAQILLGMEDMSHWTAWQVQEDAFRAHLQPLVELICDALTIGYLRPALERIGVENAIKYSVWYDAAGLIAPPDKTKVAGEAHDRLTITDEAYVREVGLDEDDRLDPESPEYKRRSALKSPGAAQDPGQQNGMPQMDVPDPSGGQPAVPQQQLTVMPRVSSRMDVGQKLALLDLQLTQEIRVASDLAMQRALERAGAKIRSQLSGQLTYKNLLRDVPNELVASVIGPKSLVELGIGQEGSDSDPIDTLLNGVFSGLASRVKKWIRATQLAAMSILHRDLDIPPSMVEATYGEQQRINADKAAGALISGMLAMSRQKLFDPQPDKGPGEFDDVEVPTAAIRRVMSIAGGGSGSGRDLASGVATGNLVHEVLGSNGITVTGRQWVYGIAPRSQNFEPHLNLDGQEFQSWHDSTLSTPADALWLGVDHLYPGDHSGCRCAFAPIITVPS